MSQLATGGLLGKYLTLTEFCTCTQTYHRYRDQIDPFPTNPDETVLAIRALFQYIVDPIIDQFEYDNFQLTYGFCSPDLRRYLNQKDSTSGIKNGRVDPRRDQHMAHEINRNGKYYCDRLGAACDLKIVGVESDCLVSWILENQLPFDSLYFYGSDRPIHISYGQQHKRAIWTFTTSGVPIKGSVEKWLEKSR
jgi:hypothetical protein